VDEDILAVDKKLYNISNTEEQDFLFAVMTFFLQKRQKEVIDRGLF
jgi:hypothetical protein